MLLKIHLVGYFFCSCTVYKLKPNRIFFHLKKKKNMHYRTVLIFTLMFITFCSHNLIESKCIENNVQTTTYPVLTTMIIRPSGFPIRTTKKRKPIQGHMQTHFPPF